MTEKQWDDLTPDEKIAKLYQSAQTLSVVCEALKRGHREHAERIIELEDRLATLESHQP